MPEYHVRILQAAEADIDAIASWISERSADGAKRWVAALQRLLATLRNSPESFSLSPEAESLERPIRQAFFKTRKGNTYRAVFLIDGNEVRVLRIRSPGQQSLSTREFPELM